MPNVRGGNGTGFGGAASAGRDATSSSRSARSADTRASSPAGTQQYAGYRGPIGQSNPNTGIAPGSYGLSSNETKQYNNAKTEYANRGFLGRAFDFMSPVHRIDPQINQPSSYAAGTTHYGVNPGGLAAGLVGGAIMPGAGLFTGPLGSAAYDATGNHEVVLTGPGHGFSTSYPDGGPGYNSQSGYAGPNRPPSQPQGKSDQTGSMMAQALGGAPFGPQPTAGQTHTETTAAQPGLFAPKIPNHSLPYGYQSAFPNSLTEEDKKLLYAQYLTGAA